MLQTIDFYILDAIQNLRCGFLDFTMPKITVLGSAGFIWIVLTLIYLLRRNTRRTGFMLAAALILGLIIGNGILKNLIARDRPIWINPTIQMLISVPTDYSFPSGHTLASFSCTFILFFRKDKLRYAVLVLATLIAFSRMYLYVHFPSDILGAITLSLLISLVVCAANAQLEKRKSKNVTDIKSEI